MQMSIVINLSHTTLFYYSVIACAGLAMLPLLCYKWRFYLLIFWARFGISGPGDGYRGMAYLNGFIVLVFVLAEIFCEWFER